MHRLAQVLVRTKKNKQTPSCHCALEAIPQGVRENSFISPSTNPKQVAIRD